MRMGLLCLAMAGWLAGCAAGRGACPTSVSDETADRAGLWAEFEQTEAGLNDSLAPTADLASASPEERTAKCSRVCQLYGHLRELAGRICRLAKKHEQDPDWRRRCRDAEARTERLKERVLRQCPCQMTGWSPDSDR